MENLIIFIAGGLGYGLLEILWRGFTHISMIITGGFCVLGIFHISKTFKNFSLLKKSLLSSLFITTSELVTGFIVNIKLNLNVWDYSSLPLNLSGQICLIFSCLWFFLSAALILFIDFCIKKYHR